MGYVEEVEIDNPAWYWPMRADDTSPLDDTGGGTGLTITGATAVTAGAGPLHASQDTGAWSFDGVDDFGQAAVNWSDTDKITVEYWLWWDAYNGDDDLAFEYGSSNTDGGFVVDQDSGVNLLDVWLPAGTFFRKTYTRPTAAAWHHYAYVLDRAAAAVNDQIRIWVDGAEPPTTPSGPDKTGNFGNLTLNIMSRNGSSLFGPGDMCHVAVYKSLLSEARIQAHYNAGLAPVLAPPPTGTYRNVRMEGASMRHA